MRPNPYEAPSANIDTPIRSHHWRLVAVLAVVLTVVAMFATMPLMLTLLALLGSNVLACFMLLILQDTSATFLAFLTGLLMLASLVFTDWGLSSQVPRIRVSWPSLIPAVVCQLVLISLPARRVVKTWRIRCRQQKKRWLT